MTKIKNSYFGIYLSVLAFLLCALSVYSVMVSNYLLIYSVFFISFAALVVGYFVVKKQNLYKMLFFFIPLSVSVDVVGESQMQLPTEPLIGMLTILTLFYWIKLKNELSALFKNPIVIVLFIELAWMVICSLMSELKVVSFKYTLVRFSYIITFFLLGFFWLKYEMKPYLFYLIYAVGMILPIINGFIFHSKLDFTQKTAYIMPQPFFNDHTVYGACIAFLIPALVIVIFSGKALVPNPFIRFLILLLLLLFFVAEYFSFSRAAWLSLACALVFYGLIQLKITAKGFIFSLIVVSVLAILNFDFILNKLGDNSAISNKEDLSQQVLSITNVKTDISNKERVNRWKCAIRMGNAKPLFGFGPRTYKFFYGTYQASEDLTYTSTYRGNKGHSHSDYLAYLAESGYLGFAIHILLYLVVLYSGINAIQNTHSFQNRLFALMAILGILTYFVHGIFNGFMDDEKMASLVYISMAVIVYVIEQEKKQKNMVQQAVTNA